MQREIKFRAWDERNEVMHNNFSFIQSGEQGNDWVVFTSDKQTDARQALNNPYFSQQLKKMQYIGVKGYVGAYKLRHKNEVELYEHDIVEAMSEGSKGTFIIKFRNESTPCFILYPAWQNGKMWRIAASDLGRTKGDFYDDLKLIGNVYENPELIKSEGLKIDGVGNKCNIKWHLS